VTQPIRVALGFDRAYAPHAAALITSLRRYTPGLFEFLILHEGVDRVLKRRLQAIAPDCAFIWREIGAADVPAMADREHFSRAILYRLGLERMAPAEWSRVLYLDVDMIATADVTALWRTDLEGGALGGVPDCYVKPAAFAERWGLAGEAIYFKSGVLLIDLDAVRNDALFTKAIEFVAANANEVRFTDQDALNFACWGRWKRLAARWNVQRHMVIPALIEETAPDHRLNDATPAIVHFTGPEKPWLKEGYHPWAWLYWDNLRRTPFWREVTVQSGVGLLGQARLLQRYVRARLRRAQPDAAERS
jgi:lipopolysaccharide biosynthesis glycosyltransferase